jgi:type IV pilus assembly protein PilV
MNLRSSPRLHAHNQRGLLLIEILVSLVIIAFGLLALAGFVTKATALAGESTQRTRASMLLSDISGRILANKNEAALYIAATQPATGYGTPGLSNICPAAGTASPNNASQDLCDWHNLLLGANDAQTGGNAAALGYRGCLERNATNNIFTITVAWGSTMPSEIPTNTCGKDQFGADEYRRVLRTTVRIPNLNM